MTEQQEQRRIENKRLYEKMRYQANREKKLEYQRKYYQEHREQVIKRVTECNRKRRIREIEQYWAKKHGERTTTTSRNQDSRPD